MPQYPSQVALSDLDGNSGFQINGAVGGDLFGTVSRAGDLNGDGFDDLIVGAASASPNGTISGAAYVVFGKAEGFTATLEVSALDGANGFAIHGEALGHRAGASVASAGDINGDGIDDIIVGAFGAAPHQTYSGASYVVFGRETGFDATLDLGDLNGSDGFQINGEEIFDMSGRSVSSAGDVNGDGYDDLLIGALYADGSGYDTGAAYVVFGKAASFGATVELSALDGSNGFRMDGEDFADGCGGSVSCAGDVNGDGFFDVIIGAYAADPTADLSGAAYVVFGAASGFSATVQLAGLDGDDGFRIDGEAEGDRAGFRVASAGDFNADGLSDLLLSASQADPNGESSGACYLIYGSTARFGAELNLSSLDGTNGFQINGAVEGDNANRVATAGDFNGDGFDDVIVGAPLADGNAGESGVVYVVFGTASGFASTFELSSLDGNNGFRLNGEAMADRAGLVSSAGDMNGDGFGDITIGATAADPNGTSSGAAYVVYGGMPSEAVTRVGTAIDNAIHGGNFDDTLRGLDGNDTLIGHGGNDELIGGGGDDTLFGAGGLDTLLGSGNKDTLDGGSSADTLTGGGSHDDITGGSGADTLIYGTAADSTGKKCDTVRGFDFGADKFDLAIAVGAIDATIAGGQLLRNAFDADLAAAADAAHLAAGHAVIFTPDSGTLAGKTFLVVDLNGAAGYQAAADLVIRLEDAVNLASLDTGDFI